MKDYRKSSDILKAAEKVLKPNAFRIEIKQGVDDNGIPFNFRAVVWNDKDTGKEQYVGTQFIY